MRLIRPAGRLFTSSYAGGGNGGLSLPDGFYSTNFPTVETRLSEGGLWLNGRTDALDANDMQVTTPGKCSGRQNVDASTAGSTRDGTAVIKGTFTPVQRVKAIVYLTSLTGTAFPEIELLLRHTVAAHSIKGIEVMYSFKNDGSEYISAAEWYGPIAQGPGVSYDYLWEGRVAGNNVVDGDTISADIDSSNILRIFRNTTLIQSIDVTATAGRNPGGNPGLGHNSEEAFLATHNAQYGASYFECGNGVWP